MSSIYWQYARNGCSKKIVHENKHVLIPGKSWLPNGTVELEHVPDFDGQIELNNFILINGWGFDQSWFKRKCQIG